MFGLIKGRLGDLINGSKQLSAYQMDIPYAVAIFVGSGMAIFNFQKIFLDA
jgi:hypothetical protein